MSLDVSSFCSMCSVILCVLDKSLLHHDRQSNSRKLSDLHFIFICEGFDFYLL